MLTIPDFDSRLFPDHSEQRRWAEEDELLRVTEAVYDLTGHELAKMFGDKFIFFLNALVEENMDPNP